jgi:thiol-disulfide isomerase/thioredoxin
MKKIKKWGWFLLVAIPISFYIYRSVPKNIQINEIPIQSNDLKTAALTLSNDSATLIHFFAHWCGPCMKELPLLKRNLTSLNKLGIRVVFITDDNAETTQRIQSQFSIRILKTESLNEIGVFSIPMTYLYNKEGTLVNIFSGSLDWDSAKTIEEITKMI